MQQSGQSQGRSYGDIEEAIQTLRSMGATKEQLSRALDSSQPVQLPIRQRALLTDPTAIAELSARLSRPSRGERLRAALALAEIGDKRAFDALVETYVIHNSVHQRGNAVELTTYPDVVGDRIRAVRALGRLESLA